MSQDALKKILEFGGSVVARAGAGTGKTYSLVGRYVKELCEKGEKGFTHIDQLAAITFTEKAAAEMKERVRARLTEIIDKTRAGTPLKGSSAALSEDDGGPEAERLINHLIRQRQALSGAYISTIHSFCARLLKENPVAAKVDPAFAIIDEGAASTMLDDAARRVILNSLKAKNSGAERLALSLGYSAKGSFGSGLKDEVVRMIPLVRAAAFPPGGIISAYKKLAQSAAPAAGEKAVRRLFELLPALETTGSKSSKERKTAEWILNNQEALQASPIPLGFAIEMIGAAKGLEDAINKRKEKPESGDTGIEAVSLLRAIAGPVLEARAGEDLKALISLVDAVMAEYGGMKKLDSLLDFDDLQERAIALLESVESVRKEYSEKFRRVLVDEFQDTNELQLKIISAIAPPESGRLFIVGDFKQSIYSFRGSDPAVFNHTARKIEESEGLSAPLTGNRRSVAELTEFTNSFFAEVMDGASGGYAFDKMNDSLSAVRGFGGGGPRVTRLTAVSAIGALPETRMAEARAIASLVRSQVDSGEASVDGGGVMRPVRFGDYALLLAKFTNLAIYENAFRLAGIPFQIVKGKGFHDAQEVNDLLNLLMFIDWPEDRLALASALRSPLAGLSDGGLLKLFRDHKGNMRDPSAFIFGGENPPNDLDTEDSAKLKLFAARMAVWRKARNRLTVPELLETVIAETGYGAVMMSRFHGEQKLANALKLIEKARVYENGGGSLTGFVSMMRALREDEADKEAQADVAGVDAVSVMTVHQSKGLEFPVVIIGDMAGQSSMNMGRVVFHPEMGAAMKCYEPENMEWARTPVYTAVENRLKGAQEDERKRLLYVAMTRARDWLILSGAEGEKGTWSAILDTTVSVRNLPINTISSAQLPFPDSSEAEHGDGGMKAILAKIKENALQIPAERKEIKSIPALSLTVTELASFIHCQRLYYLQNVMELSRTGQAMRPGGKKRKLGAEAAEETGNIAHSILETIDVDHKKLSKNLKSAVDKGFHGVSERAISEILANLERAIGAHPLSDAFSGEATGLRRETPLVFKVESPDVSITVRGAADLMWEKEGKLHIADYKYYERPADESRNILQLKMYAYAIALAEGWKEVNASVIYLKEKKNPVTSLTIGENQLNDLWEEIIQSAKALAAIENRPENEWKTLERNICETTGCVFSGRCHLG